MFSSKRKIPEPAGHTDDEFNALQFALYQMCGMDDTVYNFYEKKSQCLPRPLSSILANISEFGTIREHFERISQGFIGIDDDIFRACVKDLHESGLLVTKNEVLSKLRSGESADTAQNISVAAWITRDRHDSLVRSIESFAANFRTCGHTVEFFVSDDSPDGTGSGELSARLDGLAKKESITLTRMGHGERRKLRDTILEKASPDGLPADIIDLALFGVKGPYPSYGANRNAVLLANAGEMILSSDDDVFCDLRYPEKDGYDLELNHFNMLDIRETYPDREAIVNTRHPEAGDILGFHNSLLGRHTSRILHDFSDNSKIKMKALTPESLTLLLRRGGQVRSTITGVSGDSGLVTPRYQVTLRDEAREWHIGSEETFRKLLLSKEVFQATTHCTIGNKSFFWGMNIGIDGRTILPPFLPTLRGEDFIFSRLLKTVAGNAMIGSLPVTIFHSPADRRSFPEDSVLNARPDMCYLLTALIDEYSFPSGSDTSSGRFCDIGTHLAAIASLPLEDFDEFARQLWLKRAMLATISIENLLKEYDYKPVYWADYLEKHILSLRDYGYSNFITAILDVYTGDERTAAETCQDMVRRFGELLKWWPVIYDAALDIRGNR